MSKVIETSTSINYETGEIREQSVVKRFKGDEPNYIKLYLKDISYLYGLPATAGDLLKELLKYVTYGTQEIALNTEVKNRIAAEVGLAKQTLNNRLQDLVNKGILIRSGIGMFLLNPYLFGKGDWKTINELRNRNINLEITYDKTTGERTIRGNLA